jgi:hypothetical protein
MLLAKTLEYRHGSTGTPLRRSLSDPFVAAVAFGLVAFYVWTAANGYPLREAPRDGYYNLLTAAFLAGQLHLLEQPKPEMFELSLPYEPGKNAPARLHDASLYRGRYYLYFGVVPAVILFVPWRLVGLGDLPEAVAALAFAVGGLFFWLAVLRRLLRDHLPGASGSMRAGAALVLGIASVVPFILRCSFVYEVAIAGGYFFLAGACFFFLSADDEKGLRVSRLVLGSLFLGLAAGCRPNLLVAALFLPWLALPAWRRMPSGRGKALLAAAVPLGLCLFLLGLYNRARFDSWTEFGARYQLQGLRPVSWFDLRAVPVASYFHFLAPPDLRLDFPFVFAVTSYPGAGPDGFFMSPSTGLVAHAPFVLVLLLAAPLLRSGAFESAPRLRGRLAALVAVGLLIPLLTSFVFASAAMRFEADFASFLVVPALLLLLGALRRGGRRAGVVRTAAVLLLAWSVLAGIALSIQGGSDGLRLFNPAAFAALERRFEPLRILLGRLLVQDSRGVFRVRMAFPERAATPEEPVLSSGTKDVHDVLSSKQAGPGLFTFELRPASGPPQATRPLPFEPGRFYDLAFELDHVRRVLVGRVDGREAFRLDARLGPVRPNRIEYGRGPRGHGATYLGRFSGTIIPEPMIRAGRPGLESLPALSPLPAVQTDSAREEPSDPVPGLLWIPAGKEGAYLCTGAEWRWIPRAFVDRVRVRRHVDFVPLPAGAIEPLLSSGDREAADAVYLRRLGGERAAVGLARWRGAWELGAAGEPFPARPGHPVDLDVLLDRASGDVVVRLDGREVLRSRADLAPIDRGLLAVGRSPEGLTLGRGDFAGRLSP